MKRFGYEMSKDAINIIIIVGRIGTMSHCAPEKLSQYAPPSLEKVMREKC